MSDQSYLTSEGADRLKKELEHLKTHERNVLAKRLRAAIQEGDLSENADYHKAKEDQAFLEGRIIDLEYLLKNAIVVESPAGGFDHVDVGATVTVQEEDFDPEVFMLVGAKETDPSSGKISNESPVGRALMGKRVGDVVTIETPGGTMAMTILKIE
jgi:transcription elongation factor GreA